jgi:hypothetical protein
MALFLVQVGFIGFLASLFAAVWSGFSADGIAQRSLRAVDFWPPHFSFFYGLSGFAAIPYHSLGDLTHGTHFTPQGCCVRVLLWPFDFASRG